MNIRKVFIGGYDVSDFIISIPELIESKNDIGQLSITENIVIVEDNSSGIWYLDNYKSFLYNKDITTLKCVIYNDDNIEFEGLLLSVDTNKSTSNITIKSKMYDLLNQNTVFISDVDTPAVVTMDILDFYGFDIDMSSFQKSHTIHTAYSLECQVICLPSNYANITLIDVLQNLANIGVASLYFSNNKFYYKAYDPALEEPDTSVFVSKEDIAQNFNITNVVVERIDNYTIKWANQEPNNLVFGGDFSSYKSLQNMDYGLDNYIHIKNSVGCTYIGNSYVALSKLKKYSIDLVLYKEVGAVLNIGSIVSISESSIGWVDKKFEVFSINKSHKFLTKLRVVSI